VLLPTPEIDRPAASLVPVTKPCDMWGCSVSGATPGANRASPTGMFENIGRASTSFSSKFAPEETDVVSMTGVSAVTVTSSVTWPTWSAKVRLICCPTASMTPLRVAVLNPGISTVTE
jgi:hypothetical protein